MGKLFSGLFKIVSTLLGIAMIGFGVIWILQGTGVAFQVGFMAGDPQWAIYGAILALLGVGQAAWSITRKI